MELSQSAATWVQAVATVVVVGVAAFSAWTAKKALAEAHTQADAAREAVAAANASADAAREAVAAANASVTEIRRQGQLARVPLIRLNRPRLGIGPDGLKYLAIHALNLGPGPALELRLTVERQDHPNSEYFRDLHTPAPEPLLPDDGATEFQHNATDLANLDADWEEGMRIAEKGVAPAYQPLVTSRIRFRLTYLSILGASVEATYLWETDRIELRPDPWTWRVDTITVNPGPENGASIVIRRPE